MTSIDQNGGVTRRTFVGRGLGAFGAVGVLSSVSTAAGAQGSGKKIDNPGADSAAITGKIALEEHFSVPESVDGGYSEASGPDYAGAFVASGEFRLRIQDLGSSRIAEMDRGGIELCILSYRSPGIQAIPNATKAIAVSHRTNDFLAEAIAKYPKRLKGFAALPLQDPQAAAQELTRCVKELRFCGALVNGFSQVEEGDSAVFYDLPQYRPFWATVQQLDVPIYLHPRAPLATRQQSYEGHPWLVGSAWGFAVETSLHALRLMGSGLFDEYPKVKVIVGHLGEGLPFSIWRVDHRISKLPQGTKAKLPMAHYLRENFYITTSGNFRTQALTNVMSEVGADHVLYSVDYPFEDVVEAAEWFDHAAISEPDRLKIARSNAQKLFRL
jgi:2,3-dihydroxybenzoate decarboxylase